MQKKEKDEYPPDALREMLFNALVPGTYMGGAIQMRVYNDKLSIWNEGGLPFGLSIEELKGEHNSRPRNPKIAKAIKINPSAAQYHFKKLKEKGLIERKGGARGS
jgi:ATP-dependent DNA helicase RecG